MDQLATLANALVEERAYNLRLKERVSLKPLAGPVIDQAKRELRAEYPGVEF